MRRSPGINLPLVVALAFGGAFWTILGTWTVLDTTERHVPFLDDFPAFEVYAQDEEVRYLRLVSRPEWRAPDPVRNDRGLLEAVHARTGLRFVLVPGGRFDMGADDLHWNDASPVREVAVAPFLLARTECTRDAWARGGAREDPSRHEGHDLPVSHATWDLCRDWCRRQGLRLPSEAEWEYACAAGSRGRWCFGSRPARLVRFAWHGRNSGNRPHPVASLESNAWGLFDMHGNVWEWCEDEWRNGYERAPADGSARVWSDHEESAGYDFRVMRGGGWHNAACACRTAYRTGETPARQTNLGFRPAADLPD